MTRITISMPDELATVVTREAARTGESVSSLVRNAVAAALGLTGDRRSELPFIGLGASGTHDTGRTAEEILAREWTVDRGR